MPAMGQTFDLVKATLSHFSRDRCPQMAAALSYYTVFSLPPLLILILALVGVFVDPQDLRGRIVAEMQALLGSDGARLISGIITDANRPGTGIMAVAGVVALLLSATGAFTQLQEALNTAWGVKPDPAQGGIKSFLIKRVLSFGMILVIAFLLLVSFVVSALVSAFGAVLADAVGGTGELIAQAVQIVVGFAIAWLLFAAMFKFLPDAVISWRDVRLGALVTALLFTVGRFGIGFYLGRSDATDAFGATAALAVLFVWIYYAAIILLVGAEFTQVWARRHNREIEAEPGAVRITQA
jgi:membrane protein